MQNTYFTPIKANPQYHRQLFNSDSLHREGDWVCVNCQNLNYSFRKKCNRCKTQSRDDNDKQSVYSYYYYHRGDGTGEADGFTHSMQEAQHNALHEVPSHDSEGKMLNFGPTQDNKENQNPDWPTVMETPKKKKPQMSPTPSKLDGLPSVSPLVKKYRLKQHHTTLEKLNRTPTNVFEMSDHGKDFESIKIRDFDQLIQDLNFTNGNKNQMDNSPFKEDQDDVQGHKFMKEIEESISRIII